VSYANSVARCRYCGGFTPDTDSGCRVRFLGSSSKRASDGRCGDGGIKHWTIAIGLSECRFRGLRRHAGRQDRHWADVRNEVHLDPNGSEHHLGYFGGANFVAGALEPILVRLAPRETYELLLPLNKFVCVLIQKDITLDILLQKRYSIRASLDVNAESARWAMANAAWRGRMQVWTGKTESSDFRLPVPTQ